MTPATVGPGETAKDDIPDDPWGNNYLFFTSKGLLNEPEGEFVIRATLADALGSQNPNAGGGISYQCDVFDRPTVLSMGPDGLPGDTTTRSTGQTRIFGTGDDITRSF